MTVTLHFLLSHHPESEIFGPKRDEVAGELTKTT